MVEAVPPEEELETMVRSWFSLQARRADEKKKKFRKQAFYAATVLLREVVRWRPHLVVGIGQGAVVAMFLTRPLVLEWACRYRATPPAELEGFRGVLPTVQAVVAVDPAVARGVAFEALGEALPEFYDPQPRRVPLWVLGLSKPTRDLVKIAGLVQGREAIKDLKVLSPVESLRSRPPVSFDSLEGRCVTCSRGGAWEACSMCKQLVHLACLRGYQSHLPIVCVDCAKADVRLEVEQPPADESVLEDRPKEAMPGPPAAQAPGTMAEHKEMVAHTEPKELPRLLGESGRRDRRVPCRFGAAIQSYAAGWGRPRG